MRLHYVGHGSPHDRGSADSWYRRGRDPHYYPQGSYNGPRIDPTNGMTAEQVKEYHLGYDKNEADGGHKEGSGC